jgi:hypothetical protein
MKKTLRKLVLDRETIKPLQADELNAVNGGDIGGPGLSRPPRTNGPSEGLQCSNCTSVPVPRPPSGGSGISLPRPSGVIC